MTRLTGVQCRLLLTLETLATNLRTRINLSLWTNEQKDTRLTLKQKCRGIRKFFLLAQLSREQLCGHQDVSVAFREERLVKVERCAGRRRKRGGIIVDAGVQEDRT